MKPDRIFTRLSLIYPASVLFLAGIGLFAAPHRVLPLLGSPLGFDLLGFQLAGMFMVVLSIFVAQTVRHAWSAMYVWTVYLRLGMATCFAWLFIRTEDPVFIVLIGILSVGIALTLVGIAIDRRRHGAVAA